MSGALQGRKMCDEGAVEPEPEFEGCLDGAKCLQLQREVVSWRCSMTEGDGETGEWAEGGTQRVRCLTCPR